LKSKLFGIVWAIVALFLLLGALFPLSPPAKADNPIKPMIFVHGFAGSGAQFESQAMRFDSNGYSASYIFVLEYDTSASPGNFPAVWARLDTLIANAKTQTGSDKVYLLGHSLGTFLCQGYLATPSRAANVAKYVNIDGNTAAALPGGVPTLALWATRGWSYNPANTIVGATNVFIPNQTHVQVATSAESFVEMYKFFTGNMPATTQIIPEPCNQIHISGRAVFFPANTGVGTGTLQIWEVGSATGARISATPQATFNLTGTGPEDGTWGPFNAEGGKNYEFVIIRSGARPHHFYLEPFIRSDHLVRLLTSPPGGIGDLMERDNKSVAIVISRNKEFWGNDTVSNDILTINGTNIINAATCPVIKSPGLTGVIGIFAYDRYLDGLTNLSAPIPTFFAVGFMTGVDIFMPGADPPSGTTSLILTPRGGGGKTQVINIQNWASLTNSISVPFNDYIQTEPISVATGTDAGPAYFSCDSGSIYCLSAMEETSAPVNRIFPYGLFSFKISGITAGSTVNVTITLPTDPPKGTEYWKYQEGKGWYQIPIVSLVGNVLTIHVTDGGDGDADGVANGIIVDPGGPAVPFSKTPVHPVSPTLPQLKRAQVSVQYMSVAPQQAGANQAVTISTNVVNTGDEPGSLNVALKINGQVEQTKMVSVGPQASQPVKFTVTKAQPGTYTVDIFNQQGSFTVTDQGGGVASKSTGSGLIILLVAAALVLAIVVVLVISFR
jgi:Lipase C-terminal domain/AF_1763-like, C-terminal domain/alpha/beta hydrolase fold